MYKSFVSLGRYIPKYFILFVAMVNGIVSLISLSVFSLLVSQADSLPSESPGKTKAAIDGREINFFGVVETEAKS